VESESAEEFDSPVNVFSMTGEPVAQGVIVKGQNRVIIDTSILPNGLYLLEIRKKDGSSVMKRVVISHAAGDAQPRY
jgi:hypothetical protein